MGKRAMLLCLVIAIVSMLSTETNAATICLRDRSTIACQIMRETPTTFEIRRAGEEYNVIRSHDTLQKTEIFAAIDDTGRVIFPDDLTLKITPGMEEALTEAMFQRRILDMQIAANERMGDRVGSIRTVLWLQFAVTLVAGALIATAD